jgi:hypothetical protein
MTLPVPAIVLIISSSMLVGLYLGHYATRKTLEAKLAEIVTRAFTRGYNAGVDAVTESAKSAKPATEELHGVSE